MKCVPCNESGDVIEGDKCLNCSVDGCENGGECNSNNICECGDNFDGSFCESCKGELISLNGGVCNIDKCNSLHTNKLNCKTSCNTNESKISSCDCDCSDLTKGVCNNDGECICKDSWTGHDCSNDQCSSGEIICKHGGYCEATDKGEGICNCDGTGFIGGLCDKEFDANQISNCINNLYEYLNIGNCKNLNENKKREEFQLSLLLQLRKGAINHFLG